MDKLYTPNPDGYCGDEDNGQTSAWYVFSALGFYPVCSGSDEYILGSPLFRKVTLNLENDNKVVINAVNNNKANRYVQSMIIDGQVHTKNYLTHDQLIKGTTINYEMAPDPNKNRGVNENELPYSFSKELKSVSNKKK